MSGSAGTPAWIALGTTSLGDAHRRRGIPNQDALALAPDLSTGCVVAVADGHGSSASFRSAVGAGFAVDVAAEALGGFTAVMPRMASPRAVERGLRDLAGELVAAWERRVRSHLAAEPIRAEELEALAGTDGDDAVARAEAEPLVAYGATVVAAAVAPPFLALLQLGDGDILLVDDSGPGSVRRPVPGDSRLVANATTSLCLPDAARDVRVRAVRLDEPSLVRLVVLTTDGYANSFVDEAAFLQTAPDLARSLIDHGAETVAAQMPGWLETASAKGSGDDITMAMLWRTDPPPPEGWGREPGPAARRPRSTGATYFAIGAAALAIGGAAGALWVRDTPADTVPSAGVSAPAVPGGRRTWIWMGGDLLQQVAGETVVGDPLLVPEIGDADVVACRDAFGHLWVALDDRRVLRVDPDTAAVDELVLARAPSDLAVSGGDLLAPAADGSAWFVIDPETFRVAKAAAPASPAAVTPPADAPRTDPTDDVPSPPTTSPPASDLGD